MLKKMVIAAIVVVVVMTLFFTLPCGLSLIIKDKAGHLYYERNVAPGDVFELEFNHSVQKVEVVDRYIVGNDGTFMETNTSYGSLGAGLPSDAAFNITVEDGNFTIKNMNITFTGFYWYTGAIPRHHLIVNGDIFPIYTILPDDKPLFLYIERNTPSIMLFNMIKAYI